MKSSQKWLTLFTLFYSIQIEEVVHTLAHISIGIFGQAGDGAHDDQVDPLAVVKDLFAMHLQELVSARANLEHQGWIKM